MNQYRLAGAIALAVTAVAVNSTARASCGSSFCSVNTQWESQGVWSEPGWRLGLRYEYLDQNQLRSGSDKVEPEGVPGDQTTDELDTLNRNWLVSADYTVDAHWSVSLQLPYVDRDHRHVFNDVTPVTESWAITGLGDARAIATYQLPVNHGAVGLRLGVKLPTGGTEEVNADGVAAERTLQPGSGTTDAIAGVYYYRQLDGDATTLFTQLLWQQPHEAYHDYAPGEQIMVDVGLRYAMTLATSAMLQLNYHYKGRDHGAEAEPDESGARYLYLSPGVSYNFSPRLQGYGFVQLPLYQYVNGTQLTPDWSAVAGLSWRL
jgi:predicted porin